MSEETPLPTLQLHETLVSTAIFLVNKFLGGPVPHMPLELDNQIARLVGNPQRAEIPTVLTEGQLWIPVFAK